jgi:hypothetical protein
MTTCTGKRSYRFVFAAVLSFGNSRDWWSTRWARATAGTVWRYYNYASPEWLEATYTSAGPWTTLTSVTSVIQSFDQTPANMLNLVVRKPAG